MPKIDPDEPCPCGSGKLYRDCHRAQVAKPPTISKHVPLPVVAEPDPGVRSVFKKIGQDTIFFTGHASEISFDCGRCGAPLMVGMARGQVVALVLQCASCGAFNDTLP